MVKIEEILELIEKMRIKIDKYKHDFANEMLVRYVLVDPLLRVLGWDTEDPDQVYPEHSIQQGRVDYALKIDKTIKAFIEVKALGGLNDNVIFDKLKYCVAEGVQYFIVTDGDIWQVYDTHNPSPLKEKLVASWKISTDEPSKIVFEALTIANLKIFGSKPKPPIITPTYTETVQKPIDNKYFKGPINSKLAKRLVLKVLNDAKQPLQIKEIVNKIKERVELTDKDKEKVSSGKSRWEAYVRWTVTNLKMIGLVERIGENQWVITEEGKRYLNNL